MNVPRSPLHWLERVDEALESEDLDERMVAMYSSQT